MSKVYIVGHRNPDLDSICSAYGYAKLKNLLDDKNEYIPVRCGHMTDSIIKQFEFLGIQAPHRMNDVYPKVRDVMHEPNYTLEAAMPIYRMVESKDPEQPSAIPVVKNGEYFGLLSLDDITNWFLKDNQGICPEYDLLPENMRDVVSGKMIREGKPIRKGSFISDPEDYFSREENRGKRPIVVMTFSERDLKLAVDNRATAIIITGCGDFPEEKLLSYQGTVITTGLDTAEALRRLRLAPSISEMMGEQGRKLSVDDTSESARNILGASHLRGLPVFDGDKWAGYVTRRCFLNRTGYKVILVDHNEPGQSIKGIETAEVIEILDHHRLDAIKTTSPLFIDAEPLGSTSTIVYRQFVSHELLPDKDTAKVLLAGLLSDTLVLRSPTATETDRKTAQALAVIGGVDVTEFGRTLLSLTETMAAKDPNKAVTDDFKEYSEKGKHIGIGQCETTTIGDVGDYADRYLEAMEQKTQQGGFDWILLMITDIISGNSVLLSTAFRNRGSLPYKEIGPGVYEMPGVVSRKKQLLPEILNILD